MGLTVASELVSQYNGKMSLIKPGKLGGATFKFDLPIRRKQ
jgi:K+-sensing histidine kinase KdpD